jgi:hypothetical protein
MPNPKRTRRTAEDSKNFILSKALSLSEELGIKNFSSIQLATACDCKHSLVFYHFVNMEFLREEVMRLAVAQSNVNVVAQGLAVRDPIANTASDKLKKQALSSLKN